MAAWRWEGITSVVQLILQSGKLGQFVQFLELSVCLVAHQGAVEVDRKHNENQSERDHDGGGGDGSCLARSDRGGVGLGAIQGWLLLQWQELHPTQQDHLGQEEQSPNDC